MHKLLNMFFYKTYILYAMEYIIFGNISIVFDNCIVMKILILILF